MTSSHPKRVLYATHEPNLTGASQSLLDLLGALDRDAVEPTVLLRKRGPLEVKLKEAGVPYIVVPHFLAVRGPQSKYPGWAMEIANAKATQHVARYLREERFDLVHSNSLLADVGMRAARTAELPYVCHVRDLVKEDHGMAFLDEVRVKSLMAHAEMNIFISQFVADKFVAWVRNTCWEVLHDAVELRGFVGRHGAPFSSDGALRLFLPGRFQPTKGQFDAIRAMEYLSTAGVNATLTLAGSVGYRDYYDKCAEYVQERGLNCVRLTPFADDVAAEYATADICLMCSGAEAMGRVTVEGMIAGCLVIGADAGATPELIERRGTGLLYEYGNPEQLAEMVAWADKHRDEARVIAGRGQETASRRFGCQAYAETITNLYARALHHSHSRADA